MILRRFLPSALLAASSAFGQLLAPTPDRLADYCDWFAPFDPASSLVTPSQQAPGCLAINSLTRIWNNWHRNAPPSGLEGPIIGFAPALFCEVVFLGQTGGNWSHFGYRLAGLDHFLTAEPEALRFGDFALPLPAGSEPLDFFIERTDGARYYTFDKTLNSATAPADDGYWGTLTPLTSCRSDSVALAGDAAIPFTVFAFAPPRTNYSTDAELFVFAVRAGEDHPAGPVPEPTTYGLAAAAALLAMALRRRRRAAPPAGTSA